MQSVIDIAVQKWKLTQIKPIYTNPNKAVYTATSADYGPVILKWDTNRAQLQAEYEMLIRLDGIFVLQGYIHKMYGSIFTPRGFTPR